MKKYYVNEEEAIDKQGSLTYATVQGAMLSKSSLQYDVSLAKSAGNSRSK